MCWKGILYRLTACIAASSWTVAVIQRFHVPYYWLHSLPGIHVWLGESQLLQPIKLVPVLDVRTPNVKVRARVRNKEAVSQRLLPCRINKYEHQGSCHKTNAHKPNLFILHVKHLHVQYDQSLGQWCANGRLRCAQHCWTAFCVLHPVSKPLSGIGRIVLWNQGQRYRSTYSNRAGSVLNCAVTRQPKTSKAVSVVANRRQPSAGDIFLLDYKTVLYVYTFLLLLDTW